MNDDAAWQFWIDVGGTFTDCIARRGDGKLLRQKVLSSAVVKGALAAGSTADAIVDPSRQNDPADFWRDYELRLLDAEGRFTEAARVAWFDRDAGRLQLASKLTTPVRAGLAYELWADQEAPVLAIRYLMQLPLNQPIPPVAVRLGTTRGTNALLTRRGARTAFVTTRGFADVLHIGYQNRPRLFELAIHKHAPLFDDVLEIDARIAADGVVLSHLNEAAVRAALLELRDRGVQSLAVCLLNADRHPQHEQRVEQLARDVGFDEISCSHKVAPLIKIVSRGDTTVVDAYLNPVLRGYIARLRRDLGAQGGDQLRLLTSAGGLVQADHFAGKDSILSGPAGGVVGFSQTARAAGFTRAIGFDMGGTSTDVSRYDGRYELQYETEKAGVRVVAPMMAIETVAAGGGSICSFDGVKLAVGPDSAGADPGPACYGRGGPLAVTDINLFLGKLLPEYFPFPLDQTAVERRLSTLRAEVERETGTRYDLAELADGLLRVANANMASAIRSVSVAKGYDARDYAMVAFGGAAPQHACAVARELGIRQILNHSDAGILSALGIGLADIVRHQVAGVYRPYGEDVLNDLENTFAELESAAVKELQQEGVEAERIELTRLLDLRYRGVDAALTIPTPQEASYASQFEEEHLRLYGYLHEQRPLEIVAARVETIGRSENRLNRSQRAARRDAAPERHVTACFDAQPQPTAVYRRDQLRPGDVLLGPAIVLEQVSTTVIDPGWEAELLDGGELLLTDRGEAPTAHVSVEADPVMLEIFNNQFAGIAEQMGITLRNTSSSVNVKERLDFSCAIFTPEGDLVVNAPHIPVHLGAMSETVKCLLQDNPDLQPGDVLITNDPYRGGSHLPDITVVSPVHDPSSGRLLFLTASRAHHAEIGGITPGSMPPFSKNLSEEGVLISNFKVLEGGHSKMDELRELLGNAPYPSRAVEDNLADIAAQIAANRQGARDLLALIQRYRLPVVQAYMRHIQDAAEAKMRLALEKLEPGKRHFIDHLDDGSPIQVTLTVAADGIQIDFTGTGPVLPGNLNANRAIVTAAVMYCMRLLINEDIPLNQGVLAPVTLHLPQCLLNPPRGASPAECAAVVGGNVETSQRVVDVLLGALGIAAASQGTMNNVLFGDSRFGYYETVCGGSGATRHEHGADAVHTHMTNTRLTDPEVLEQRYPVRVLEFAIRRGSGGRGRRRGGNGVVRKLQFLRPLDLSLLTQRRGQFPPYGVAGGEPGQVGHNQLQRREGERLQLSGQAQVRVETGDVLILETPGGGGYGAPEASE